MRSFFLFTFIILGLFIVVIFAISIIKEKPFKKINATNELTKPIIYSDDLVFGNPMAPIVIIEFGDYKCSACKKVEPALKKILETYPNQVKLIWKGIPGHNESENALMASYCAQEQGQALNYHNLLFLNQSDLNEENIYFNLAQSINLNLEKFNRCLSNQVYSNLIQKNLLQAQELRIDATPYFFIGEKSFFGAISFEQFQIFIQEELKNHFYDKTNK